MVFDTLKACLLQAPILGFLTEDGRYILDTDASLFAVGGILNHLQESPVVPTSALYYTGGKCWLQSPCVLTSASTCGAHSLRCALFIVRSGDSRTVLEQ